MFRRLATVRKFPLVLLLAVVCLCVLPPTASATLFTLQSTVFITAVNNNGTGVLGQIDPVFDVSGTLGTITAGVLTSGGNLDIVGQDVFIVDLTLDGSLLCTPGVGGCSFSVNEFTFGVETVIAFTSPTGAGVFADTGTGIQGTTTVAASGGFGFPNPTTASSANLEGGETTVRLFVTYAAGNILANGTANFMVEPVGTNTAFTVQGTVIPEPASLFLLGAGMVALGVQVRRRRSSRGGLRNSGAWLGA